MIQRIQTIYLLLITGILITAMCLPIGTIIGVDYSVYIFKPLGLTIGDTFQSTWGLFCILLLTTIVDFATIFLFRNRMLQIRMAVFSICLLVGYYLAVVAFYFALEINNFNINWALCLPAVAIILNYLAIRAIGADEAKVHAADRLR